MKFDAVVLGAGMVGTAIALHLQQRAMTVALVDRKPPGSETSFGNAGLIQQDAVYPYAFPRELSQVLRYASNRSLDVRYHVRALPRLAPFLFGYWFHSEPGRHAAIARSYAALVEHCGSEHRRLAASAGAAGLLRSGGWLKVFRTEQKLADEHLAAQRWHTEFGVAFDLLDAARLQALEPCLGPALRGGIRYTSSMSVGDPQALVQAYAGHFERLGGRIFRGDASTLAPGWSVATESGPVEARAVVVAMGPWSDTLCARLGYRVPLGVKRGYHMHYAAQPGAALNHPVLDAEKGYLLAPMARGIRLTTGVEMALRDAPASPKQLALAEPVARGIFPLGARLDAQPWLGSRPCLPDMLPVIGPGRQHDNLWFAFGHGHHGLTLGPITGRLVAEMMTGAPTLVDVHPFRLERF
jgi:D-amino-acid dehydrogenase